MKLTVETLKEIATEISNNSVIFQEGMVVKYQLPKKPHDQLNEDLHYRVMGSKEELVYTNVIEVNVLGVKFEIVVNES